MLSKNTTHKNKKERDTKICNNVLLLNNKNCFYSCYKCFQVSDSHRPDGNHMVGLLLLMIDHNMRSLRLHFLVWYYNFCGGPWYDQHWCKDCMVFKLLYGVPATVPPPTCCSSAVLPQGHLVGQSGHTHDQTWAEAVNTSENLKRLVVWSEDCLWEVGQHLNKDQTTSPVAFDNLQPHISWPGSITDISKQLVSMVPLKV